MKINASGRPWKNGRPRLAVISISPAPYRDRTFERLHARGTVDAIVYNVLEGDTEHPYWDLERPAYPARSLGKGLPPYPGEGNFDAVVIPGHRHGTCLAAILHCVKKGIPIIYSADSIITGGPRSLKKTLSGIFKRRLLERVRAAWVPGLASRVCLEKYGLDAGRIFQGCYNLDAGFIAKAVSEKKALRRAARAGLDLPEDAFVFLMVANFTPKRNHETLIRAFSLVEAGAPGSYLVLAGKGETKPGIQAISKELNITRLRILDPVPFRDLPAIYSACDSYVHSGGESYSTALAYAAAAGLPIISSRSVGASWDFVSHGHTGYLVEPNGISGFSEAMINLARDRALALRFGERAQSIALERTPDWAAGQLESAVFVAVGSQ